MPAPSGVHADDDPGNIDRLRLQLLDVETAGCFKMKTQAFVLFEMLVQ